MQQILRAHIEKIVPLTDSESAFVYAHFTTQNHNKRTFLFQQGDSVHHAYFVISGLLMLTYTDTSGKQHVVSFAMEDWWESDYQAYYNHTKATMSLQCLEDSTLLCITLENWQKLCADLPKIEHFFHRKSNAGNLGSQQRILSFITANANERYDLLLKRYPTLIQRVPKSLLASYLGVSRETLSRLTS